MMTDYTISKNNVLIGGILEEKPVYSHEVMGEKFFSGRLCTKRDSGTVDYVPFIISEKLFSDSFASGAYIHIEGNIRTFNMCSDDGRHLVISVFVDNYEVCNTEDIINENKVILQGFICKRPIFRKTPLGRNIADVLIAVNRPRYGKSDYIPCIVWGRNALFAKNFLSVGMEVVVTGRFQSRTFMKQLNEIADERTAYEISAQKIDTIENDNN